MTNRTLDTLVVRLETMAAEPTREPGEASELAQAATYLQLLAQIETLRNADNSSSLVLLADTPIDGANICVRGDWTGDRYAYFDGPVIGVAIKQAINELHKRMG